MTYMRLWVLMLVVHFTALAQTKSSSLVYTSDIDRFWVAYDSARTTQDTLKQRQYFQRLYIDAGTEGLHAFMKARNYDARLYTQLINKYPKFWNSVRPNTLKVKTQAAAIEASIKRFKKLYPEMSTSRMYFTVGGLRSGGTVTNNMVLVGTEIATADKNTDAAELSDWLKSVFENQDAANLVSLNIHEYVHTQQKGQADALLVHCIKEGSADFIAELVTHIPNNSPYMVYGRAHEAELKNKFKIDMFSSSMINWLYNGTQAQHADLGYFMGYIICKAYYNNHTNKKQAIQDIIELNYADESRVVAFLSASQYYPEAINKDDLLKQYAQKQPVITSISPAINDKTDVQTILTELTFNFSEPMGKGISINLGEGGKEHFPITGVVGFGADAKSFTVKLSLQPRKKNDFLVTGRSFRSQAGYPLKEYKVNFSTQKAE
jgi:hypothetical protein